MVLLHVKADIIKELHEAVDESQRHEGHRFPVMKELLEHEFVAAYHVNRDPWVHNKVLINKRFSISMKAILPYEGRGLSQQFSLRHR